MSITEYSKLAGKVESRTSFPISPFNGQMFYHSSRHIMYIYDSTTSEWYGRALVTTTSTSSSTTTTSTSTTTTSTSTTTTSTSSSTTTTSTSSSTTTTSTSTTL